MTGDATYTAQFSQTKRSYTVSWVIEGVTVASGAVEYGATPTYGGATPTKESTAEYSYTFSGWSPAVAAVTGEATYTALFTATPKEPENPDEPYDGTETIGGVTWSYTVTNGEATITDAQNAEGAIVIPETVNNGVHVVAIESGVLADNQDITEVTISRYVRRIGTDVGVKADDWAHNLEESGFDGSYPAFGNCESLMNYSVDANNEVFEEIGGVLYYRDTPASAKTLALYPSGRSTLSFADGLTVTKIGDGACAWCHQFTELTIPSSVREIGVRAFDFCREVVTLTIPSSVTNLCYGAFLMNIGIANLEISGTDLTIGNYAFYHGFTSSEGTRLVLNEGVKIIGRSAFEVCWNLTGDLVIPEGVTSIGRSAFSGAYELTGLTLPSTLTFIGADAFGYCEGIQRLVVPLSVEEIEIATAEDYVSGAFAYCSGLAKIYMPLSLKPVTEGETQTYLANIFEGVTTNNTDAERLAEILVWYSDYSEIVGGEEPGVLPASVTTGGNAEWTVDVDGSWKSGDITDNQETWAETTVTGPCLVTFSWKVSSESGYDFLHLTVDGDEHETISGITDWVAVTLAFRDSGSHMIRWSYTKDSSASDGEDCGWVKDFTVTSKEFATFTVTWKNWDGTVLATDSVAEDDVPEYNGATPAKPKDSDYFYVFSGWTPDVIAATENVIYTATFTAIPNLPASIATGGNAEWFVDTDGSWRSGAIMNSQSTWIETTVTGPCLVTFSWKASSEGGGYDMLALAVDGLEKDSIGGVMSDWVAYSLPIPDAGTHTIRWTYFKDSSAWEGEDCGWVKDFTVTPKTFATYTVTWKNWDGTVLEEDSVVEGYMPQYRGSDPARATDEDYYYVFSGWTPDVAFATGDAAYTATFTAHQARFEMIMSDTTVTGYIGLVPKHITLADWPEGVTAVGDDALTYLHDLESVEIPATVETIGTRAFYNTGYSHLTNITFEAGGTAPLTIGFAAFYGAGIESITFPARLVAIRDSAFYLCSNLETVTFLGNQENVEIDDDAFKSTPYYAHLPFKMRLMEIDGMQKVVGYQGTLPEVITAADWPAEATAVAGGSLGWNSIVKDITIPATITQVDTQAFLRSYELTNVVFQAAAAGVDPAPLVIKNYAFGECDKLRAVTFREGLSRIEEYAFYGCPLLAEINFPESGTEGVYIADAAFAGTEYESHLPFKFYVSEDNIITGFRGTCPAKLGGADGYPWPEGVDCIGSDAFSGCTTLEHVTLPPGITAVALGAFRDCSNLATVNFANSFSTLTTIGGEAFSGCTSLETVELDGDSLYVDRSAFEGCSSLTTLTFGGGVSQVDEYAFAYTTSLETFVNNSSATIDETAFVGSAYYKDMPFSFITKRQYGELVIAGYKGSPTQINAEDWPAGVTYVNRKSFTFCGSLRAIAFPAHIEYIDEGAFACCTNLVSITFPEESGLTVGHNAFALCTKIQNVTLRSGMEIEDDVFAGCASLETVIVEEGLRTINAGAFARTLVRSMVLPEGIHWVYNDSFAGNDGDFTVYIPRNADDGNYGVSDDTVVYEYMPRIFGLETEEGWARYGFVKQETTTNLRVVPYCRVTLDLAGGTGVATTMLGTGATVGDQIPRPTKAGSTFAGWTSANVAEISADTTWTEIIGTATGMEAILTAMWTPSGAEEMPAIEGDDDAEVTGDAETGFVITPSAATDDVVVVIPDGVDATKVTVKVSPEVESVKANGANIVVARRVVEDGVAVSHDITPFLDIPAPDANGVVDMTKAAVKKEIVKEPLDPAKGAEIELVPENPELTTSNTRPGLIYTLFEGESLDAMRPGAWKIGDGKPWKPAISVKGGRSGFYRIAVTK
ncbi:MAG: leucine-rich repeat protein [Kiritimatiellae bacterium]|nr:leucine-rich repeat protein [Kiritimatiellia bacterium]